MFVNKNSGQFCVFPDSVNGSGSSEVSPESLSSSLPSINHNEACMCSLSSQPSFVLLSMSLHIRMPSIRSHLNTSSSQKSASGSFATQPGSSNSYINFSLDSSSLCDSNNLITTVSSKPKYLPMQQNAVAILHPMQSLNINKQSNRVIFFTINCLNKISKNLSGALRFTHRTYCLIHQVLRWCHDMQQKVSSVYLDNYRKMSSNIFEQNQIL